MGRKDELEARVRQTPLSERLDDCRTRIGKMCSEGRPPRMTIPVQYDDDDFYISTTLSDAQATIADLQGQVDKLKARLEIDVAFNMDGEAVPAPPNMPDGIECRDATIQLQDKEIAALQQRVDQLEGELSTPTWVCDGCGRVSSEGWINVVNETPDGIDYDMACPSCGVRQIEEDSAADLVRELERREDQLTTLQDDHARVLGLVRDFVAAWDHDGEPDAMSYETAVDKARPYLASLPAPPAQGARCDQCGTRLAHEDHKYDCPYMIVKRQHAEGETRA